MRVKGAFGGYMSVSGDGEMDREKGFISFHSFIPPFYSDWPANPLESFGKMEQPKESRLFFFAEDEIERFSAGQT